MLEGWGALPTGTRRRSGTVIDGFTLPPQDMASTTSAHAPAQAVATRHDPDRAVTPARKTGAAAQPRLPVMPCTEKACPSRAADTRLFRMVKSAGWKGALPRPANADASINPP